MSPTPIDEVRQPVPEQPNQKDRDANGNAGNPDLIDEIKDWLEVYIRHSHKPYIFNLPLAAPVTTRLAMR